MLYYLLAIIPIYLFVYLPFSHLLLSPTSDFPHYDFNSSLFIPDGNGSIACLAHTYTTYIISREPLVVYISGFLSPKESEHLIEISESEWEKSTVWSGEDKDPATDTTVRVSETALIPRTEIVQCIEQRALAIQGWRDGLHLERLRTQRYRDGGHYVHHFDWRGGMGAGADRISSFMVYVDADCDGGGTNFPRISKPSAKWCSNGFVECENDEKERAGGNEQVGNERERKQTEGVTFKPVKGNAVFWENLRADGSGYDETWHAGMPVLIGSKIGLNIWTWAVPEQV